MVDDDAALPVSHKGEDPSPEPVAKLGFGSEIEQLTRQIREARGNDSTAEIEILLQDLETAVEELRVADEEVRAQHDHVARLLQAGELVRWRYERMMGSLPVPVVTTDTHGRIRSVNPTAAALFGVRIDLLLRKPLFVFVSENDRSDLRSVLSSVRQGAPSEASRVTLHFRTRDVTVNACPSRTPIASDEEITWLLQPFAEDATSPVGTGLLAGAVMSLSVLPATSEDPRTVIQRGADLCADVLAPGCHVSVCLGSPTEPTAIASSDTEAQVLDCWQIEQAAGPSVSCYSWKSTVSTIDLTADDRWRGLSTSSVALQVGVVAAPLLREQEVAGVLTVGLDDGARANDPHVIETVEVLGAALGAVIQELGLRTQVETLMSDMQTALESRAVIDQAKGIVMAHKHCTADEAFQHLVSLSNTSRVKLREVAARLVEQSGG